MRLARVIGTVEATVKHPALSGKVMLVVDLLDDQGGIIDPANVAIDTCGAGVGDHVLVAQGSSARMPSDLSGAPVDAAVIAIVDRVTTKS